MNSEANGQQESAHKSKNVKKKKFSLSGGINIRHRSPSTVVLPQPYEYSSRHGHNDRYTDTPMELPGSAPKDPPVELDDTACDVVSETSMATQRRLDHDKMTSPQDVQHVHYPGSSKNEPGSIMTRDGVVLTPNLTCDNENRHRIEGANHVTSFMTYRANESSR
ncbi:hypothetical protein LOZ12_004610 [Ophidiomyces ophidiicola]|uniref:Uncharacterized protein n=1 Tax=Ophidiomyces ophidiicola TaxID=1387563 RepID=A0ACB8USQ5_9EURO|nr:hypothetical protein LOZ64_001208 [Ophidiomyces ophidiicola]KAI1949945.1 hypothetical protein LOZ62_002115 [Ophidiomyces ophidiicola]KAI2005516.1 hypothetical protein LOZ50_003599 [Ophidiomyces ophidiicola]KAI2036507.1 hypothetical protein LOZ47_004176 [Ophidiomyces ophidiicola]KAI2049946.1 hypothetical protein LOZ38_003491 [Ophidiomyces ophidiicola]